MANKYYHYDPSLAAAVIFAVLFALSSIYHGFQIGKSKTWYFIPFLVGCFLEVIGYLARIVNADQTPDWTLAPYIIQALLILLGPSFFAASIYMILGRLIRLLNGEEYSLIRSSWLTKIFVVGDVVSIAVQGIGGARLASAETQDAVDLGQTMVLVGLGVQIAFFSFFIVVTYVFHHRINKNPTPRSLNITLPWRRLLNVLYITSLLILVRSIFRVAEYATGRGGELQSREIYIYIFDSFLMLVVAVVFNVFHPSQSITSRLAKSRVEASGSDVQLNTHPASSV